MSFRLVRLLFALAVAAVAVAAPAVAAPAAQAPAADAAPGGDPFTTPWVDACLDCLPRVDGLSNRSAALAPDGALHVVLGGDGVTHLTYNGGAPLVETLEDAGAANVAFSAPVVGMDNRGRVHALYLRTVYEPGDGGVVATAALRYARQTAQGWRLESLPYAPRDPFRYTMAVAPDGRVHVSAHSSAHTDTGYIYATRDAEGWSAARPFDNLIFEVTLALDPAGRPAACYPNGSGSLALARHDGAAWQMETIPAGTRPTSSCVVAFAADGRPHLVYRAEEGLLYLRRDGAGWARETIVAATLSAALSATLSATPGYAPSLRLDADGRPHVAFHTQYAPALPTHVPANRLHYATRTLTGWKVETVDGQPDTRQGTMLLAGSAPYVVYRDRLGVALGERRDGQWASLRLQRSGDVGYGIALLARGLSWRAAHYDLQNRAVFYAAGGPAAWRPEVVDQQPPGPLPQTADVALAVAAGGAPHLVYEFTDPLVSFTHATGGGGAGWQRAALPGDGCGPYRVAIGPAGRAAVTLHRCGGGGLAFVLWPPSGDGATEVIDAAARVYGGAQAMAGDGQGRVHVAYTAAAEGGRVAIRYALRETDGRWTRQTVSEGTFGGTIGVGLALDAAGRPVVVFNDDAAIAVATPGAAGGAWQIDRRLGGGGLEEGHPGIAVDALGRVHLLYNSAAGGGLVYGRRDAAGWRTRSLGPARAHHALALDPFGNPAVAYRDEATGDARLVYVPAEVRGQVFAPVIRR